MKYLKYALIVITLFALCFMLIGVIKPTVAYDCEVMVEKPLAESWQVAQDPDKMSDWLAGFKRMEHVSGTPGTVGAVSDVFFDEKGEEMSIRETITGIVPNESISMSFESDFMDMDYEMKMSAVGGQTKISSSTIAKGNGAFSKSIMALVSSSIKAQEVTNLTNLKGAIERNVKDYAE